MHLTNIYFAESSSSLILSLILVTSLLPLPRAVSWTVASAVCVFQTYRLFKAQTLDIVDIFMAVDFLRSPLVWFSL